MKLGHLQSKIGGIILGFSLLFGIGVAPSTTAQAQERNDRDAQGHRDRDYSDQDRDRDRDNRDRDNRDRDRNNGDRNRRGRNGDGYPNYGGSFQLRQTALNAGYNEGIKEGRNDRRKGNRHSYQDFGAYQKATKDYSSRLGDRELYRRYFRDAFPTGYTDGLRGN
jgi:hypothetical protein